MLLQAAFRVVQVLLRAVALVWAAPYTLIGLFIGMIGYATGGCARVRRGTVEFYGGAVTWFVSRLPVRPMAHAITFGHTILGRSADDLDTARDHELVHVRQYEIWGPFFGPAYLLCSLVLWLSGRDAYHDNPFERQAFQKTGQR